ncbi:GNAT family N-acetyltransferase [Leptothoe kymatousa TAU-MAC 1615]|uniref:GNAT family N-acetyltransferase n=1 Tax=Leptothoe kymatousa TAU-MAC 1615 TaxID=2364775 RepID=A0ABS5Y2E9_9CYAN|nr:GNAT family N-acetyltransferase [Leptothoe kymatousa TAU-MAC 1615]
MGPAALKTLTQNCRGWLRAECPKLIYQVEKRQAGIRDRIAWCLVTFLLQGVNVQFLPATENHYGAIGNLVDSPEELYLVCPTGHYPWDEEQLQAIATQRQELTVGQIDSTIVAFSNLYDVVPQQSAFIGNVVVAKAHRGKGLGKCLIQHMAQVCQTKYQAWPHLSVFNNNTRALLLYTELGFRPYGVESKLDLNQDRVALIHMKYGANRLG